MNATATLRVDRVQARNFQCIACALADLGPEDRRAWLRDFIQDYCAGCFQAPVRHLLCIGAP